MATHRPQFRATIYQADDVTPLAPRAGAPHADPFQVSTLAGMTGWQPYMQLPSGRRGRFDRLRAHAELGEVAFKVLDKRLDPTDNLTRWVTAFSGDDFGRLQYKNLTCKIEISLDNGVTWRDFFVGKVHQSDADDPARTGPLVEFVTRDHRVEAFRDVFVGPPHRDVTYARPSQLFPLGLEQLADGRGWADLKAAPPFYATVDDSVIVEGISGTFVKAVDIASWRTAASPRGFLIAERRHRLSEVLARSVDRSVKRKGDLQVVHPDVRIWMRRLDTQVEGVFDVSLWRGKNNEDTDPYDGRGSHVAPMFVGYEDGRPLVSQVGFTPLPTGHPERMDAPADGTLVEFIVFRNGEPDEQAPILIDEVHPAQLLKDLLDGKFGELDDLTGEPRFGTVPYDAASFDTLIADTSFPKMRMQVTQTWDMLEFMEQHITRVSHIGLQVRNDGRIYAVDLRRPVATGGLPTVTDEHVVEVDWQFGDEVITTLDVKYPHFYEQASFIEELKKESTDVVNIPATLLDKRDEEVGFLSDLQSPLPVSPKIINAASYPVVKPLGDRQTVDTGLYDKIARPYLEQYGTGAAFCALTVRRVAGLTDDGFGQPLLWPGDWFKVDVSATPDPASNLRGGVRLMMLVQIEEDTETGLFRYRALDGGPDSVAVAPALSAAGVNVSEPRHAVDVTVTLNAAEDTTLLGYAITPTSELVRPDDDDARWRLAAIVTETGARTLRALPAGRRVWLRAQSVPFGKTRSGFVYAGPVDTTALPTPSGLTADATYRRAVELSWTNGDNTLGTQILLTLGAAPGSWVDADVVEEVSAGTDEHQLLGLDGPTVQHTAAVRHIDAYGGVSSENLLTFSTNDTPRPAPAAAGLAILIGEV